MCCRLRTLILFTLLFAPVASAVSQTIFRCEADGEIVYSDIACTDGTALVLPDNRGFGNRMSNHAGKDRAGTATQRSQHAPGRDARRNLQMQERQRKADAQRKQAEEKKKTICAQLEQRKKWAEKDQQTTTLKNLEKAQRKTQRATERYLAQCAT